MNRLREKARAFTLIELLVVFAVLAVGAATFLPALARTKAPARRIYCANNLKGIGQASRMWAQDHGHAFPMRVAVRNGGYNDFVGMRTVSSGTGSRGVFGVFRCLSNELSSPNVLICPAEDEHRFPATTFASVTPPDTSGVVPFTNDLNVSYFVGVDAAETNPRGFLAGDHNLGSDGNITPLIGFVTAPTRYSPSCSVALGTNFNPTGGVGWLNTLHSNQGNIGLADGSVSQYNRVQLQTALHNSGDTGGHSGGNFINPQGCTGLGVNRIQFP